jgi:hypothetical protein
MVGRQTDNRGVSGPILRQLESLGYIIKLFRVNGVVEIHAVRADGTFEIARCNDGNGEEETYRAVCLLAKAVGIAWKTDETT